MQENTQGAVIVISSHVMRGSVGNRAAVFALETLGHQVWALPTIVLPWHPGHGRSTRLTFAEADFEAAIDDEPLPAIDQNYLEREAEGGDETG